MCLSCNIQEYQGHFINVNGTEYEVKGNSYAVFYQAHLSNDDYTSHKVYYIKTDIEEYPIAKRDIIDIMTAIYGKLISSGQHTMAKTISESLQPYYEFRYMEDLDMFEFIYIRPYDD